MTKLMKPYFMPTIINLNRRRLDNLECFVLYMKLVALCVKVLQLEIRYNENAIPHCTSSYPTLVGDIKQR